MEKINQEGRKTWNSQHNIEGEKQSWRVDTTTIKLQWSGQCGISERRDK